MNHAVALSSHLVLRPPIGEKKFKAVYSTLNAVSVIFSLLGYSTCSAAARLLIISETADDRSTASCAFVGVISTKWP